MKAENDYTLIMTKKNLNDAKAAPKTFWSILNRFYIIKRFQQFPPPLLVNGKFVSDFCTKVKWKYNATICIQNQR